MRRRWRRCGRHWKRPSASALRASAARGFSVQRWCRRCSTACSPLGCCGRGTRRRPEKRSIGAKRFGICGHPSCRPCSNNYRNPVGYNRSASSKCWTGRLLHSTEWIETPSLPASTRARPSPTFTSHSSKPLTPTYASNSASGTRPPKWCATWSPALTRLCGTISAWLTGWRRKTSMCSIRAAARERIWPKCCAASPPIWKIKAWGRWRVLGSNRRRPSACSASRSCRPLLSSPTCKLG